MTEKLLELPPAWRPITKATVGALVNDEARALIRLQAVVDTATRAVRQRIDALIVRDSRRAAEAAVALVQQQAGRLARDLAAAIADVRLASKRTSLARLLVEWTQVQLEVTALGEAPPAALRVRAELTPTDRAESASSAQSFAAAWSRALVAGIWDASDASGALGQSVANAARRLSPSVRRTAATENSKAFADARSEAMSSAAVQHRRARWFIGLVKRWDGRLDALICNVCGDLHGTLEAWGRPFPDGREPGHVHPNCRCVPTTVFLSSRIQRKQ